MLGQESRDRKRQSPNTPVRPPQGGFRPDRQASRGNLDHKAQAPSPNATAMTQTCRQKTGFDRRIGDPERARRNHRADGSDAANPWPGAPPDRFRRGGSDGETADRVSE